MERNQFLIDTLEDNIPIVIYDIPEVPKFDKEYTPVDNSTNRLTNDPTNEEPTYVTNNKDTTNKPTNPELVRSEIIDSNDPEAVKLKKFVLKTGTDQIRKTDQTGVSI